jgi:hypothetical protein
MFFIAGMPRSRTKWFSEYLSSYEGVTCWHELLNGLRTKQAFYDEMQRPGVVGNSDSGLFITDFQKRWPDAPTVVLLRDPDEVRHSLTKLLGTPPSMKLIAGQFVAASRLEGLQVWYNDIDERMEEIHQHIGIEYNQQRHEEYKDMNIQLDSLTVCLDSYKLWINFEEVA